MLFEEEKVSGLVVGVMKLNSSKAKTLLFKLTHFLCNWLTSIRVSFPSLMVDKTFSYLD